MGDRRAHEHGMRSIGSMLGVPDQGEITESPAEQVGDVATGAAHEARVLPAQHPSPHHDGGRYPGPQRPAGDIPRTWGI